MRTTLRQRLDAWQHSVEREVAPHVEAEWAQAVLLELRVRGVDGARIGEVLAEVDSHCVESGQSAREAFGRPDAYAESLALPGAVRSDSRTILAIAAAGLVQTVGMLTLLEAFDAWLAGESLGVTVGQLVLVGALAAALAAVAWRVEAVLRATLRHPVRVWLATMAHLGVTVTLLLLLDTVALRLDAIWSVAAGVALLLAGTVGQVRVLGPGTEDPVVGPLAHASQEGTRAGRATRLATRLPAYVVPASTVLLLVVTWWAGR
jgi:hypothetical protein